MRRPIRELPSELISQIAAGEVVERPASVVKELSRTRSTPARPASRCASRVAASARSRSTTTASGIAADELAAALRRHATSKIASVDDLEGVAHDGLSRRGAGGDRVGRAPSPDQPHGEAAARDAARGAARRASPSGARVGTTVEVRDLFFNTPARRKFLKSEATELAHCVEAVRRHALARPELAFAVWHDGKPVARWARASAGERAADILGADLRSSTSRAVAVEPRRPGDRRAHRNARARRAPRADLQYVYVNGRHVRDKLIAHAVRAGVRRRPARRSPARVSCCSSTSPPERVDVNVHPTKIEVRFRDGRAVHESVRKAVAAALAAAPGARLASETATAREGSLVVESSSIGGAAQRPLRLERGRVVLGTARRRAGASWLATARPRPRDPTALATTTAWPLGRALAPGRRALRPRRERARAGDRRHARGARADRLRAAEGEPRRRAPGAADAADPDDLRRRAPPTIATAEAHARRCARSASISRRSAARRSRVRAVPAAARRRRTAIRTLSRRPR